MAMTPYYKMQEWAMAHKPFMGIDGPHPCNRYTTILKVFLMHMTWDLKTRQGWNLDSYRKHIEKYRNMK